jgi:hypothetical protein
MTPQTHAELSARCQRQQPRSHERALPCTPGRKPPPARTQADLDALARTAQALHTPRHVDVVALQEVDGPDAARQVFRQGWKLDCFERRAHPQKVGFAIREGVPYRCNSELSDLDVDGGSRAGADLTLYPGTAREVRLLNVHLKSGCFRGDLDRRLQPLSRLATPGPGGGSLDRPARARRRGLRHPGGLQPTPGSGRCAARPDPMKTPR